MVHQFAIERTFHALADPTRLAIVERLALGESSVSNLADPFDMSLTAVAKHLAVLESAGVVRCRKQGRVRTCELDGESLDTALEWLRDRRAVWEGRLDRLGTHLEKENSNGI